jgi:hypothetical protein
MRSTWTAIFLLFVVNLLAFEKSLDAQSTYYFPQFVDGGGYKTTIYLTGLGQTTANVTIDLFDQTGAGLSVQTDRGTGSTFPISLSSNGQVALRTLGSSSIRVGWARVTSTIPIGTTEVYHLFDTAGQVLSQAGVLPTDTTAAATVFISVDGRGQNTGIALANVGLSANTIAFTLYNQVGTVIGTSTAPMAPRTQIAKFIDQLPGFERINVPLEGTLGISGLGFFSTVGLLFNGIEFSALPTLPGRIPARTSNTVQVLAIADLWLAGAPAGTVVHSDAMAPLNSPPEAGLTLIPGRELQFTPSGSVDPFNIIGPTGPSGAGFPYEISCQETNGVSAIEANTVGLAGVFLGPTAPAPPAPIGINFTGGVGQLSRFEPQLRQVFYIGTGNTTNQSKRFVIPESATRLFLGSLWCFGGISGNTGSFSVTVSYTP